MPLMKSKFSRREKILVLLTLSAMVMGAGRYLLFPLLKDIQGTKKNLVAVELELEKNRQTLKMLRAFDEVQKIVQEKEDTQQSELTQLIQALSAEAKFKDLTVTRIYLDKYDKVETVDSRTYILEVEAPFLEIGKFLEFLENSPLAAQILTVEAGRPEGELLKTSAKIKLQSYIAQNEDS